MISTPVLALCYHSSPQTDLFEIEKYREGKGKCKMYHSTKSSPFLFLFLSSLLLTSTPDPIQKEKEKKKPLQQKPKFVFNLCSTTTPWQLKQIYLHTRASSLICICQNDTCFTTLLQLNSHCRFCSKFQF